MPDALAVILGATVMASAPSSAVRCIEHTRTLQRCMQYDLGSPRHAPAAGLHLLGGGGPPKAQRTGLRCGQLSHPKLKPCCSASDPSAAGRFSDTWYL